MDSRILEHPHAQFGGMVGFPYPLGHHHVYELAGHQLQSAAASVPFSIDGLLSGSCAASVVNPAPLIPSGCGVSGDSQPFKLAGRSGPVCVCVCVCVSRDPAAAPHPERVSAEEEKRRASLLPPRRPASLFVDIGVSREGGAAVPGFPPPPPPPSPDPPRGWRGWGGGGWPSAGSILRSHRRGATRVP